MDAEIGRGLAHPFKAIVLQRVPCPSRVLCERAGILTSLHPCRGRGGVARAFDLAETARSVSDPLLLFFCKGGYDAADIMRFSSPPSLRLLK